jgi:hypothetical protein
MNRVREEEGRRVAQENSSAWAENRATDCSSLQTGSVGSTVVKQSSHSWSFLGDELGAIDAASSQAARGLHALNAEPSRRRPGLWGDCRPNS